MINATDIEAFRVPTQEECLQEFIYTFKASLDPRLWLKLIKEELKEAQAETIGTAAHLKEIADLLYVIEGFDTVTSGNFIELLGASESSVWMDLMAEAHEEIVSAEHYYSHGIVFEAFQLVHQSNMSKLGTDGKPIFREDGKVLKGPNYKAPDLSFLV
jgi:hypothetical protein|tara:strand:- start:467 stop:940 length:474 start_codon:yes stop_codon:yes gene_type:complete